MMIYRKRRALCVLLLCIVASYCSAQNVHLPSSKEIAGPVPGAPQPLNSLPMAAAWSPDHRYLALVNAGFGTVESNYDQSIAILDTGTGKLTDYPEPRTDILSSQTLYSGIAFSADGSHIYASFDSISAPEGGKEGQTGNAIGVYKFTPGGAIADTLTPERHAWVHVAEGEVDVNGTKLTGGDAIGVSTETVLNISATKASQVLLFDLN